jgi:phospholipase/lecithinase/hemolysin
MSCLIVFGDSLLDGGNAYALRGDAAFSCPPHWRGRRCDGPVWVEQLAGRLGLPPLIHALAGGTNHAYGGARSGAGLSPKGMPNLLEQVAGVLGEGRIGGAEASGPGTTHTLGDGDALVVLRAGANDYLDAPPTPAVGETVNRHLLGAVERLAEAGLRRFLVPSELPWGFSPIQLPGLGEPQRQGLNALIAQQNAALRQGLADLAARRDLVVVQPDFHALFLAVRADPAAFGFTEIARPVLELDGEVGGAALGSDATTWRSPGNASISTLGDPPAAAGYLWWDSWAHLTTAFHARLAERAVESLRGLGMA